jgi:hypothetical protein
VDEGVEVHDDPHTPESQCKMSQVGSDGEGPGQWTRVVNRKKKSKVGK